MLEVSVGLPNIVASSIYDTKRINYLSMVTEQFKRIVKEKIVYNLDTGATKILELPG